jgi:hypothetical protein
LATVRRKHTPLRTMKKRFQRRRNIMDRAATTTTGFKRPLIARQRLACPPKIMSVAKAVMVVEAELLNLQERPLEFRKRSYFVRECWIHQRKEDHIVYRHNASLYHQCIYRCHRR